MGLSIILVFVLCGCYSIDSIGSQKQSMHSDNYRVLLKRTSDQDDNQEKNRLLVQSSSGTISDEQISVDIGNLLSSDKEESQILLLLHQSVITHKDRLDSITNRLNEFNSKIIDLEEITKVFAKKLEKIMFLAIQNEEVINQLRDNEKVITSLIGKEKKTSRKTKSNRHLNAFIEGLDLDSNTHTRERSGSLSKEDKSSKKIKSIKRESKRN